MCINLNAQTRANMYPYSCGIVYIGLLRLGSAPAASWLYKAQLIEAAAAMAILPIHLVIFLAEKPGLRYAREIEIGHSPCLKRHRLLLKFLLFCFSLCFAGVLPQSYQTSTT